MSTSRWLARQIGTAALAGVTAACPSSPTALPPLVGEGTPVLFIGNSYLYSQDIPGIVQALADSAGGEQLAVMTIAGPDMALIDHWREGVAQRSMAAHAFKWVVLQQGPSSVEINRDSLRMMTKLFADEMAKSAAIPALFSAWPSASRRQDFDRAIESYRLAAEDVGGVLLPVAAGWLAAWDRQSTLQLYADGLHPSTSAAYLSALIVYARLLNQSPQGLPASLRTRSGTLVVIDPTLAGILQDAAVAVTEASAP